MTIAEIKKMAKNVGVKAGSMKKDQLIHAIQLAEGNFDCFGKAQGSCEQNSCAFRSDCLK